MSAEIESLDHIFKSFKVRWYRCPVARSSLHDLMRASDVQGWMQALGHLALVGCTGALTYYFFDREIWIGFALALFAHGTFASFLVAANHELGHGTVFRTKWLNALFLRIYSVLAWHNFHEYARSHTFHHIYTLHRRADREVALPLYPSLAPLYLLQLFTLNVFGGLESRGLLRMIGGTFKTAFGSYSVFNSPGWLEALYADKPEARKKAVNWARIVVLFHLGLAAVSFALGLWIIPVLVSLAPAIANWHRYFVGVPMHCGLQDDSPDFRRCVRTITLDPLSEFLYWRMNWHLEHHMFASVPCYNLKKLHKAVAHDMPEPRTLVGAWREMRQTWRRQQEDPSYQFDTPLPPSLDRSPAPQEPEAASIGDLEPGDLARGPIGVSNLEVAKDEDDCGDRVP